MFFPWWKVQIYWWQCDLWVYQYNAIGPITCPLEPIYFIYFLNSKFYLFIIFNFLKFHHHLRPLLLLPLSPSLSDLPNFNSNPPLHPSPSADAAPITVSDLPPIFRPQILRKHSLARICEWCGGRLPTSKRISTRSRRTCTTTATKRSLRSTPQPMEEAAKVRPFLIGETPTASRIPSRRRRARRCRMASAAPVLVQRFGIDFY